MKNTDHSFKVVAAIILAGVFVAFADPGQSSKPSANAATAKVTMVQPARADTAVTTAATE